MWATYVAYIIGFIGTVILYERFFYGKKLIFGGFFSRVLFLGWAKVLWGLRV
ncbi:MAG: hypothetical protein CM1200mP16_06800 [Nitrospina sp.]|nr:MAG: hypothetical protein CM1200mP16_06800 [Nitrospina sp.]